MRARFQSDAARVVGHVSEADRLSDVPKIGVQQFGVFKAHRCGDGGILSIEVVPPIANLFAEVVANAGAP